METELNLERVRPMATRLTPQPLLFRPASGLCSLKIMQAIDAQAKALPRAIASIIKWNLRPPGRGPDCSARGRSQDPVVPLARGPTPVRVGNIRPEAPSTALGGLQFGEQGFHAHRYIGIHGNGAAPLARCFPRQFIGGVETHFPPQATHG
jgi:hypothetical protein